MRVLLRYLRAVVRSLLVIVQNLYCIPTHVLWLTLLLPVRRFIPNAYYRIEGLLFSWLLAMVSQWSWTAGYNILECGDDITRCLNKRTLVISNHQSTADVPLMMAAFNAKSSVLSHIMWIMDKAFKYTNFGVVSAFHQDFFIASGKAHRDESITRFADHLRDAYIARDRQWLVLFPEGGFLRKRRPVSQRFAAKNNFPVLEYVTLPRMGALLAIKDILMGGGSSMDNKARATHADSQNNNNCNSHSSSSSSSSGEGGNNCCHNSSSIPKQKQQQQYLNGDSLSNGDRGGLPNTSLPSHLDYILDITIAYPEGKPLDLLNIVHGWREPCNTYFYYRVYSIKDIPKDEDHFSRWMYDRFIEKESLLRNFYKTNTFEMTTTYASNSNINNNVNSSNSCGDYAEEGEEENNSRSSSSSHQNNNNNFDNLNLKSVKMNNNNNNNNSIMISDKINLNNNNINISNRNYNNNEMRSWDKAAMNMGHSNLSNNNNKKKKNCQSAAASAATAAGDGPYLVQQDMLRFVILHIFFITSTYFHLQIFNTLLNYYHQMNVFAF